MAISFNHPNSTRHFLVAHATFLLPFLISELNMPLETLSFLLSLGSIYVNKKRVFENRALVATDYVRVHVFPKRFPILEIDWKSLIFFQNEDFLVINKPPGIPVHGTLDNYEENITRQLSHHLKTTLLVTQRLDVPVTGLFILAKTKSFQTFFNRLLASHQIEKHYHALTAFCPPIGLHTHFMEKSLSAPKILSENSSENHLRCELEILSTTESGPHYLSTIHLLTGRTHQIRAQLSALECPILGDTLYGGTSDVFSIQKIALHSAHLSFREFNFSLPSDWAH